MNRFHKLQLILVAAIGLTPVWGFAGPVDDAVAELQQDWDVIRYQTPVSEREKRLKGLSAKAHQASEKFSGRAEPLIWEGIIVSSWAAEKGGLGALGLAKQAKALYEQAIEIDGRVLEGSAYNSLGVLYYKVPGWPIGFGDKPKAKALLEQALAINPQGLDSNYFYAEYLVQAHQNEQALSHLEKALLAPPRPGRQIADTGRREEARALIEKIKLNNL